MLSSMTGEHQRLAWSIIACCLDVKMAKGASVYVIDKAALMLRSGNRLDNAARDLQAVLSKAIMRSKNEVLDGKPLFRQLAYAPGLRKVRGGKITVEVDGDALRLMSRKDVARVPLDTWQGVSRQVGFALLVYHYADLGIGLDDRMPPPEGSPWTFEAADLAMWSKSANKGGLGRFVRDYVRPAIADLNQDELGSLIDHKVVTGRHVRSVTVVAAAKSVERIVYVVETGPDSDVKNTARRRMTAKMTEIDADARKDMRQAQLKKDFGTRKSEARARTRLDKRIVDTAVAELKTDPELRARALAELKAELLAESGVAMASVETTAKTQRRAVRAPK